MASSPSRRRGRPPVHGTRDEVVAAAARVLAEHGLEDTSLARLASELGFSPYVLTHHFGSREGLVAAVVAHVEQHLRERVAASGADPDVALRELLDHYWRAVPGGHPSPYLRLWLDVVLLASRRPDRFGDAGRRLARTWVDAARSLLATRAGPDDDGHLATLLVAAVLGLEQLTLLDPAGTEADGVLAALARLLEDTPHRSAAASPEPDRVRGQGRRAPDQPRPDRPRPDQGRRGE